MERLNKRKQIIKGQLTRTKNYIDAQGKDATYDELQARLLKVQELYKEFSEVEDCIFDIDSTVPSEMDGIDDAYFTIVPKLQGLCREKSLSPLNGPSSTADDSVNNSQNVGISFKPDFKLPRLSLPIFDGSLKDWHSFYDIFVSTVHENTGISPAQKFKYLLGQLRGPPYKLICHFRIDDANYYEAFQRLTKRYDKQKLIVSEYIKNLLRQPNVNKPNSPSILRIHDAVDETVRGLKSIGPKAEHRDPWIVYLAFDKLDEETKQLWRYESSEVDFPSIDEFLNFLLKRSDALSDSDQVKPKPKAITLPSTSRNFHASTLPNCPLCIGEQHNLYQCTKFINKSVNDRREFMAKSKRCYNCLSEFHVVSICKNKRSCQKCNKRHNTLLHLDIEPSKSPQSGVDTISITTPNTKTENYFVNNTLEVRNSMLKSTQQPNNIHILPTANIQVMDNQGNWISVRALLDSGSTHSFVTEACAKRLKVPRLKTQVSVATLNNSEAGVSRGVTNIKIRSIWDQQYHLQISALIIPTISTKLPSTSIESSCRQISSLSLPLADQEYYKPAPIDILLGCDHFFDSLIDGKINLIPNVLIAQNTRFGWIIGGNYNQGSIDPNLDPSSVLHVQPNTENYNLEQTLRKFWETEELPKQPHLSDEERNCVEFVKAKVSFINEKIVLQLPFKQHPPLIEESYSHALKRFHALERRLSANRELKHEYIQFLREYESLGHMERIPKNEIHKPYNELFYLPHHPVFKESSSTTRLRVVFDASAKSRNGQSLNDNLPIGPTIQENLSNILLRFRKHRFVISADIEKMFRQIFVSKPDSDYQRILWRESPDDEIKHYRLSTVTYGTATAPFLATYALQLLAENYEEVFPIASSVLRSDFYMDDLISGANTLEEALNLQRDLISLLKKGNFRLRKWSGNHPALLDNITIEERELSSWNITDGNKMISVLGIKYHPIKDLFYFKIELPEVTKFTKRIFLSETSRIYDPLGFLAPVTIALKILYQKLWIAGIDWDDKLTPDLQQSWLQTRNQLDQLSEIKIPRWLYTSETDVELHGFADASKDAYAAVIYSRTVNDGIVNTNLIAAKTRVAPIKIVSVPKLELCGATLLTRLLRLIIESLKLKEDPKIYLYTDSTITLNWLSKPPKVWETYIANRTSEILTYTNRSQWYHVKSFQNPADLATRGMFPQDLINNSLWFNGPEFVSKHPYEKPQQFKPSIEPPSMEISVHHSTIKIPHSELLRTLINRISNFRTMTNVLGYILRFIKHSRNRQSIKKVEIFLSASEFQEAQYFIFRMVQAESYGLEIKQLKNNLPLPKSSNLFSFHPFLNGNELLRVGGRLSHADINYDAKHPIFLPMKHPITELIVREMHHKQLHAGLQQMMSTIRQQFQIPRLKNLIRQTIHRCFVCRRHKGQQQQQLMGQLPECRVTRQVKPFVQVGTDLAGPFVLKTHRNRGAKTYKAYLVVFICMATKAVSLEIVSDLSTTTFIAALKRFCAVRGYCHEIFCDNGTNFVGASKELRDLYQTFTSEVDLNNVQAWCTEKLIKFHFIPPAAPSFGGLWEAAVKSCKFHIRRVLGETHLTYEEFLTLIKQIEALLNSRPIGELSPDSYDPLTPGHFLITQPLSMLPEPDLTPVKMNKLTRWQLTQQMHQGFWNRWSKEYLTSLNKFQKWHKLNRNLKTGDLVLISNQGLPPSKWPLARISAEHPGDDGVVRVVTLKLPNGTNMKRPVNKLCLLPSPHQID